MKQGKAKPSTVDVVIVRITGTSTGGRSKPLARSSRRQEHRREIMTLRHVPTGREGDVEIPIGHYSKKQLQSLREDAKLQFLIAMER
jgi:hypothetical protein